MWTWVDGLLLWVNVIGFVAGLATGNWFAIVINGLGTGMMLSMYIETH